MSGLPIFLFLFSGIFSCFYPLPAGSHPKPASGSGLSAQDSVFLLCSEGDYSQALSRQEEILQEAFELGDSVKIGLAFHNTGKLYRLCDLYYQAIENHFKSQEIFRAVGDSLWVAHEYNDIGYAYLFWEDYDKTLYYYSRALDIYTRLNDKSEIALVEANIGFCYNLMNNAGEALAHHQRALHLYRQLKDTSNFSKVYHGLGQAKYLAGNYADALRYFDLSMEFCLYSENDLQKAQNQLMMSKAHIAKGDYPEAEKLLQKAWPSLAQRNSAKWMKQFYQTRYELFLAQMNYKEALTAFRKSKQIEDSIFSKKLRAEINALQLKYETAEKEQRIILLESEYARQKNRASYNRKLSFLSASAALLLLTLLILMVRENKRRKLAYNSLFEKNERLLAKEGEVSIPKGRKVKDSENQRITKKLVQLMEEKKIFLKPDLRLSDLARRLKTNPAYLSEVINQLYGKNFNSYINEFRIKESLKCMHKGKFDNYNMEGIAACSGFQSRVTFTNAFKKYTGIPPSFYLEKLRGEKSGHQD